MPLVERTPAITSIGCDLALVTTFSKQLVERLVAFECRDKLPDALALWKKWKHLRRLRCSWPDDLELVRDGDRTYARLRPGTFFKDSGEGLSKLPAHIRRLDVIGNRAWFDRASKALGDRFEMEFHPPPSGLISGTKA